MKSDLMPYMFKVQMNGGLWQINCVMWNLRRNMTLITSISRGFTLSKMMDLHL